jgi:hypothetical protein
MRLRFAGVIDEKAGMHADNIEYVALMSRQHA